MKNKLNIDKDSIINNYILQQLVAENPQVIIAEDPIYDVAVDGKDVPPNHAKIILAVYLSDPYCNSGVITALGLEGSQSPSLDYIHKNPDLLAHFKQELTLNQDICCKYGSYLGMLIMDPENLGLTQKIIQTTDDFSQLSLEQKEKSQLSENIIEQESKILQDSFSSKQETATSLKVSKLAKMIDLLSNHDDQLSGTLTIIARTLVENLNQGSINVQDQDLSMIACLIYYRSNEQTYLKFCEQALQKLSIGSANAQKLIEFTKQISTNPDLLQPVNEATKSELLSQSLIEKIEKTTAEYRQKLVEQQNILETKGVLSDFLSKLAFDSPQEEKTYVINHLTKETHEFLLGEGGLFHEVFNL
ncbi:hypothetical protein [Candidatus Trichorickettsia mobilis]|uniref:hypothetical protein n=1 Tax=Candidatus Trichorickettsia mobilis TaxID=1346319 RepID=UPI00292EDB0A|nr:hypothetical protein [Candidatus Trichorickettsia mobilis]